MLTIAIAAAVTGARAGPGPPAGGGLSPGDDAGQLECMISRLRRLKQPSAGWSGLPAASIAAAAASCANVKPAQPAGAAAGGVLGCGAEMFGGSGSCWDDAVFGGPTPGEVNGCCSGCRALSDDDGPRCSHINTTFRLTRSQ